MMMLHTIYLLISSILLTACNPDKQIEDRPSPIASEKTAVFAIRAWDHAIDTNHFNRWAQLDKTKGFVHIFSAPDARQDVIESLTGIKHYISANKLSEEMSKVIAEINVSRLIITILTHGAPSGNWCYENQRSCNLTEDSLIESLKKANQNSRVLKQVLIIPVTCYSKIIMDRFDNKTRNETFQFDLAYLKQADTSVSATFSAAYNLILNHINPFKKMEESDIETFLSLETVNDFLNFNNGVSLSANSERYIYNLKHINRENPFNLADFGFDPLLRLGLKSGKPLLPFPFGKTVAATIENMPLSRKYYENIASIYFIFEPSGSLNLAINGNPSMVISNQEFKDIKFGFLVALLSRRINLANY